MKINEITKKFYKDVDAEGYENLKWFSTGTKKKEYEMLSREQKGSAEASKILGIPNPRPPAGWWSHMYAQVASGYPREPGESMEHYEREMARITAGIWWKLPEKTRARIIKDYD